MKQRLKIIGVSLFVAALCGVRLEAQESAGAWSSVEAGPVLSRSVPVNVKAKASERVAATPQKFVAPSAFSTAGFPGNQMGPRISRPEQNASPSRQTSEEAAPAGWTSSFLISTPEAVPYPKKAVRRGWEGRVVLTYEVLPDGSVGRVELTQSSGHALLDEAARDAVKKWKFQPALKAGQPVKDVVETPVTFKLEDDKV
ncbi:MAG: energy transducer TonB [Candidatus Omnitrophota bacterium]